MRRATERAGGVSRSRERLWLGGAVLALGLAACKTHHTVHIDPIEVKPMTLNVNIRVEREVEDFFDFKKQPAAEGGAPVGGTQP